MIRGKLGIRASDGALVTDIGGVETPIDIPKVNTATNNGPAHIEQWLGGFGKSGYGDFAIKLYHNRSTVAQSLVGAWVNTGKDAVAIDAVDSTTITLELRHGTPEGSPTTIGTVSNDVAGIPAYTDTAFSGLGSPVSIPAGYSVYVQIAFTGNGTDFPGGSSVSLQVA